MFKLGIAQNVGLVEKFAYNTSILISKAGPEYLLPVLWILCPFAYL